MVYYFTRWLMKQSIEVSENYVSCRKVKKIPEDPIIFRDCNYFCKSFLLYRVSVDTESPVIDDTSL